ncbi:MAG: 2-deoxystreptamine glucosyltransferase, partial [Pseudomonadota bacterium]
MDRPKQLLLINQYFAPSTAATAVLLRELVEDLAPFFSLTILCESSADGDERAVEYRIERRPLPSWIPEERAVASKALRWVSSFLFMVRAVFFLLVSKRYDVVVLASEPPFIDLVAGMICWLLKRPFVILTQDLYPEFAEGVRVQPVALFAWPLKKLHSFVARKANRVIAISPDHVELLATRGVRTTTIIPNWAPSIAITSEPSPMPPADGPMIIQYSGNLGLACDLNAFETALRGLASTGDLSRFQFILRG